MNSRVSLCLFSVVGMSIAGAQARAHIALTCPPARYAYSAQGIKTGPCGATSGTKSNKVTHLIAGQPLTVTFTETVGHPGFFRVSLDTTGAEGFPAISKTPQDPVVAPVLADNILPHTSATNNVKRTATITVPTTTCAKCVLQLTQFMSDNPTSGYYECADVVIDAAGSGADFSCDGATGMGGKSGAGGKSGMGGKSGGGGSTSASGGATGSGGDTASSGGTSGSGSGGSSAGGATSSGGSSSGGATGSGGSSSGGATSSGGSSSSGGITASGGASSSGGSNGSGGSPSNGSGGSSSNGSGGAKGATDDGAGGCAYAGAGPSGLALMAALTAFLLALGRRRPLTRGH